MSALKRITIVCAMLLLNAEARSEEREISPATRAAIAELSEEIQKTPAQSDLHVKRGHLYASSAEHAKAAADFEKASELGDASHYRRAGAERFFAGEFVESIADFDKFAAKFPDEAPQLWERGISLYYAKRYADGRKQFESHKSVNPHDVENAAWHFICAAKETSVEKARATLIFIDTDQDVRVPMKQVYQLFKGEAKPEDVLTAANAEPKSKNHLCYAHLYLGLFYEAAGDETKAREHMKLAATDYAQSHYMGEVARVHWEQMQKKK